ncbi:hypothetical protein BT63DRAFT_426144 [Microthyrium microscopicum]|uniref:Cytochrome P450 n=1 Tax=Microthyrium microscopicum TaxID=703497 RepID=A0A6A6UBC5_9PEZI|nr:hypothetical protein BT63DRAFT_426144 [Microthyrium microscopicum]
MGSLEVVVTLALALLGYILSEHFLPKHDPREPPLVKSVIKVPFIGHLLGMLRYGHRYYAKAGGEDPPPIFTIDMLLTKTNIVTTLKLMQSVQRNSKTLSFDPLLTSTAERVIGVRGEGLKILKEKAIGGHGVNASMVQAMLPTLLGDGLDKMNKTMIAFVKLSIDDLVNEHEPFDLYAWIRHAVTIASTDAVYGSQNPYRDPEIEQAFWDWDTNIVALMPNILQSIIARKPLLAREKIVERMKIYFKSGVPADASEMTKSRWK